MTARSSTLLALAGVFAGSVWLSGCGGADAEAGARDPNACMVDDDCPATLRCQFGVCSSTESRSVLVSIEIAPPAFRPELVRTQLTDIDVTLGSTLPVARLEPPIRLSGAIAYDDAAGAAVSATVRFRGVSGIPGESYSANARTASGGSDFEIELPPGLYDVTIIDDRIDAGRVIRKGVRVAADAPRARPCDDGGICQNESFVVPAPESYVRIRGRLERETPIVTAVSGARIDAVSVDGRFESTHDVTDAEGVFDLFVPPDSGEVLLRMRPELDERIPRMEFPAIAVPGMRGDVTEVAIRFGPWPDPVEFPLVLPWVPDAAADEDPYSTPVVVLAQAELPLSVEVNGVSAEASARYEHRVEPDAVDGSGTFVVAVPRAQTTVTALALDGAHDPAVTTVDGATLVGSDLAPAPLALETVPRSTVVGSVYSEATGVAVGGALVRATLLRLASVDVATLGAPSGLLDAATESSGDGSYDLRLLDGTYRFDVEPSDDSVTARLLLDGVEVAGGGRVDLELADAGVVLGLVVDPAGEPVPGCQVQAWSSADTGSVLLWEGVTDADGTYRLLLPESTPKPP